MSANIDKVTGDAHSSRTHTIDSDEAAPLTEGNVQSNESTTENEKKPPVLLVIGMAGAGKTTFMQRINSYVRTKGKMPYVINLDPAVKNLNYAPNIDIRDTINYKEVMKQYQLGPNGGILTSLNLFATRFEKVLEIMDKRASQVDYCFVDTPGQIEIFTWSASGAVITESLASTFPTVVVYVIDTPRCVSPITFVSNMLYACSIMYKTRLPMVIALNKADVVDTEFVEEWMTDFDALQDALSQDDSYMSSLSRSMGQVLEEFYNHMQSASVSAVTGQGMEEFFHAVDTAVEEYENVYKPELERIRKERDNKEERERDAQMERIQKDMGKNGQVAVDGDPISASQAAIDREVDSDAGEEASDDDDQRDVEAFDRFISTQK
eukprot:CFRG2966T1